MNKRNRLFFIALFLTSVIMTSHAQRQYPVSGIFKQMSIDGDGCRTTKMLESVYKLHDGPLSLMFWVLPPQKDNLKRVTFRVEAAPNPEDPFCQKINVVNQDSLVLSWFNNFKGFYNYPTCIWIDEGWKRVKNDANVDMLSDILTHHADVNEARPMGTWKTVAVQFTERSDSMFITRPVHKIYGEKGVLLVASSLYNIEASNAGEWRAVEWLSDKVFTEAGIRHEIVALSPTKMVVSYPNNNGEKLTETFVREDVP